MTIEWERDNTGTVTAVVLAGHRHTDSAVIEQIKKAQAPKATRDALKRNIIPLPVNPSEGTRCWSEGIITVDGRCNSCGGNTELAELKHRRRCHHPLLMTNPYCHREFIPNSKYNSCSECEYEDTITISKDISVEEMITLILRQTPIQGWPFGWNEWKNTKEAHWRLADKVVEELPSYPQHKYDGRGVTISGGGKYWASAYICARMVRHWCNLPIQVWYLGKEEYDARYIYLLQEMGIECVDAEAHPARKERRIGINGFSSKFFAALNSPFEEVLSLDPDSYLCSNPEVLFEHLEYCRVGGIYWPDDAGTEAWTRWPFWGIEPFGHKAGLETGQYLLNKRIAWEQVQLIKFYEEHHDWCYGQAYRMTNGDYGDKGPPRAAWAKLRKNYVMFNDKSRYERIAYIQPGPDGVTPFNIHRCHSKAVAEGSIHFSNTPQKGVNVRANLPMENFYFAYLDILKNDLLKF